MHSRIKCSLRRIAAWNGGIINNVIGYLAELFYNRSSGGNPIIHLSKTIKNGKSINCRYNKYPCIIY